MTKIEWAEQSWNPLLGCRRCSAGCEGCYAEDLAQRLVRFEHLRERYLPVVDERRGRWSGASNLVLSELDKPKTWERPRDIFVDSMADLFFEGHNTDDIRRVWDVMLDERRHRYLVLTKRPEHMRNVLASWGYSNANAVSDHIYLGTSVCWEPGEVVRDKARLDALRAVPARRRWVSIEPLLGPPPAMNWRGLHWMVVGGESGPRARSCAVDWVENTVLQAREAGVAVFVKQLGRVWAKANGLRDAKGGAIATWPEGLRIRERLA